MAIQYPNFRADPGLRPDFSGVSNLGKNIAAGYQIGTMPAQIRQQREAQAIQQALQQQQMQKYQAQSQLYGQQAQLYPYTAAADIASKQAQAMKYQQMAKILSSLNEPQQEQQQQQQPGVMQQGAPQMGQPGQPQQPMQQQGPQGQPMQQPGQPQPQPQQQGGPLSDYQRLTPQQKLAIQLAGGNVEGMYPEEVTREKEQTKADIGLNKEALSDIYKSTASATEQSAMYDGLISKFSDPEFINAVGPVNNIINKWDPKNTLYGTLEGIGGSLQQSIIQMGIRAPAAMLSFSKLIKPNVKDTALTYYGKAIAGKAAKDWQIQFNLARGNYIRRGMDPQQAAAKALEEVPFEPVLKRTEALLADARLAADYKRAYPDQTIRGSGKDLEVSVPGSRSFVKPSQLKNHNGKLFVQLPGTNQYVPNDKYDLALEAGRIR